MERRRIDSKQNEKKTLKSFVKIKKANTAVYICVSELKTGKAFKNDRIRSIPNINSQQ